MRTPAAICACAAALMLVTACSREEAADGNEAIAGDPSAPLSVCVVNEPLLYFAERIGGPDVPCGNTPRTGDYLSVMKQNVHALRDAGIDR
jgi:ABC-type Zn uptake system ZnuABC Zn-binding protein ZnuA